MKRRLGNQGRVRTDGLRSVGSWNKGCQREATQTACLKLSLSQGADRGGEGPEWRQVSGTSGKLSGKIQKRRLRNASIKLAESFPGTRAPLSCTPSYPRPDLGCTLTPGLPKNHGVQQRVHFDCSPTLVKKKPKKETSRKAFEGRGVRL